MIDLTENVIEQTEQLVNEVNNQELHTESDEEIMAEINALFNVSDEEINSSMNSGIIEEEQEAQKTKRRGRKRKAKRTAEDIVKAYMTTKGEQEWKDLQEFFWYGIKQFAYKYTKNWDDAYDMTIDTFIRALENMDSYDETKAKFSTWLWTICRNNCLYFLKQKDRIPTVDNDLSDIYDSEMVSNACSITDARTAYRVKQGIELETLDNDDICIELYNVSINEMKKMKDIDGQILQMKLVDNMKIREIADLLGMNESSVKNHLYKGKENLSRILKINHKMLYDMYIDTNGQENSLYI